MLFIRANIQSLPEYLWEYSTIHYRKIQYYKAKDTGAEPMSFAFIEGCMICAGKIRRRLRNAVRNHFPTEDILVVFFRCCLYNGFGNCLAVFNKEYAKNTENKHNGAVYKQ